MHIQRKEKTANAQKEVSFTEYFNLLQLVNQSARAQDYLVKSGLGKTDGPFRATEDFNLNSTMQGTTTASHSVENMEIVSLCKPYFTSITII